MDISTEQEANAIQKWMDEVSAFIPEPYRDQILSINQENLKSLLIESHRWLHEHQDAAYNQVSAKCGHDGNMLDYLSRTLKIPPSYFETPRQEQPQQREQVLEALDYYLTQAMNSKQGADRSFSNDIAANLHGTMVEDAIPDQENGNTNNNINTHDKNGQFVAVPKAEEPVAKNAGLIVALEQAAHKLDKPITKYKGNPRPSFVPTEAYHNVLRAIDAKNGVVHIHGISGNGKSQTVLASCQKYAERGNTFVWCFAYQQNEHEQEDVLKLQWEEFTVRLAQDQYISSEIKDKVLAELKNGQFTEFFKALKQLKIPVLFAVEVGMLHDKSSFQQAIQYLLSDEELCQTVQLLIASRQKESIFPDQDIEAMPGYTTIKITGFTNAEATEFLKPQPNAKIGEDGIEKLASILAYSPLRLVLAKAYCLKYGVSYKKYYDSLGKDKKIVDKEKQLLAAHKDLGQAHGYEVILKSLQPNRDARQEDEDVLQYDVIQMMSFVLNEDIPDVLLGRFYQEAQKMTVDEETNEVKYLMSRLQTDCDMMVHEMAEPQEYGQELFSMHKDILYAVQLDMSQNEKRKVLAKVLHAVIGLVDKDNRSRGKSKILYRLMRHTEEVVNHARDFLKAEFNINKPKLEDFEIQMCLSRLYELKGFSSTQHAESRDRNFQKAIEYLWLIASSYSGFNLMECFRNKNAKDTLEYEENKDPRKTAEDAYERIRKASQKIPEDFVAKHYTKHYPLEMHLLKDIKAAMVDTREVDWDEIEEELKTNRHLSEEQIKILEKHQMLLNSADLRKVFLSERIASVLHSRGRQVLYLKNDISVPEQKRYEWYTYVGLELTRVMAEKAGIKTTFEYIIEANNKLPRMLHKRTGEGDLAYLDRLREAREIAKHLKDARDDAKFYENGVYKKMLGTPYSDLNALKYVIKANTKMYKIRFADISVEERLDGLKYCDDLYKLSKIHAAKFGVASSCMIHAGKYYGAAKKHADAFQAFESGFIHEGKGISHQLESNVNIYAWALYNTGRAIHEFGSETPDIDHQVRRFLQRYERIKDRRVPGNLKKFLDVYKQEFELL